MTRSHRLTWKDLGVFLWATRKELTVWLRDPKVLAASLFAPLVLMLAFSAIASGRPVELAVSDLDNTPTSRRLVELLGAGDNPLGGKYYRVLPVSARQGAEMYAGQRVLAWLTIPAGFEANLAARRETHLQLALDNYHSDFAKNARLYLNEAFVKLYEENAPQAHFTIQEIHESGRRISWVQSIGMGLVGLAVILAGLFNGFNGLLTEYQTGTIQNLLLTPRSLRFLLLTKIVYALLGALLSGSLMLALLYGLTGLPVGGALGGFVLLALLAGVIYTQFGLIIALFLRRYMPAAATSMVFGVTTWFLSGSLGELKLYTPLIRALAAFFPITYMEEGLRGLMLYQDAHALWNNAAILALFALATSLLLGLTARRRLTV